MEDEKLLTYLENFITEQRKERFESVLSLRTNHFTVAVEDVFQMHNTSAVIRSCEIFGVQNVHLIEQKYGKRLDSKIAMGAQKWVTSHRYNDTSSCIEVLKNQGYKIVATTPHLQATMLDEFDISQKSAFFFGTEKSGLSQQVIDKADQYLKIPMVGFTESLNISVSVAIILQQLTEKLRKSQVNWQLCQEDLLKIKIEWTKNSVRSLPEILKRYEELKNNELILT